MEAARPHRPPALVMAVGAIILLALAVAAWAWQARMNDTGRHQHTNRLIHETSPYLLQHAHNPVDWYPWGPEAFDKAKKEGKPIFLSIGYSSCHWCHVMERESFESEEIARLLNDHFVAIKVDREQRPDLDEIYMTAVQMMTGSGGWPMTTLLTPDGKPFFGGTYLPREQLAELLRKAHAAWTDPAQRPQLEQTAERVAAAIGQASAGTTAKGEISPALVRDAVQSYLTDLDPRNGGFGRAPKFPPSMQLALMLAEDRRHPRGAGHPQGVPLRHAIELTLDHMARGGIYDQIGGGFHRYSTDERWLVPHFEKMLYDNALLSALYLEAYQTTKNAYYRRIGAETLDFVLRELHDPNGGFRSTLDADSQGEEGGFYLWTPQQVIAVLGSRDGAQFNRIYDITPEGNFQGRSIPNLLARPVEAWAKELKTTPAALWVRLDRMRTRLRAAREKRVRPPLDDKVLANWNGLILRALAAGYQTTGVEQYRQAAERAADFLLTTMRKEGKLLHSYRRGRTQPDAFLDDYSFLIVGLLDLYDATAEPRWLTEALALAKTMVAEFWDEKEGTFFTTPSHHEVVLARLKSAEDNATPSGASMAALGLVRLSRLTGDPDFRAKARRVLETHAGAMKRYPQAMPQMLLAAETLFTTMPATAAPSAAGGAVSPPGAAAARSAGPVRVTVTGAPRSVRPGEAFEVTLRLEITPGWHVNAHRPADPALVPTRVDLAAGAPFRVLSVSYPEGRSLQLPFSERPLLVYDGPSTIRVRLKAPDRAAAAARTIRFRVRYQPCDDHRCLLPTETVVELPVAEKAAVP